MRPAYASKAVITDFVVRALKEDIGEGDFSTLSTVPENQMAKAELLVKEDGIIAGLEVASEVFNIVSKNIKIDFSKKDGDQILTGEVGFTAIGSARALLMAERLVLNILQRMSGIATYTRRLSTIIKNTNTRLLDTRKTTPNFRVCEKWAVSIGGGYNHRFGLYDMMMLKDNHIDLAGGIAAAIKKAIAYNKSLSKQLKIEVETRTLNEVQEVLDTGHIDRILLDNMGIEEMKTAVNLIGGRYETEASGGITESNLLEIAQCGVNFISVGALTHQTRSLDMSLKMSKYGDE